MTAIWNPTDIRNLGAPPHRFFDDFDMFVPANWTITTTEAGAGSATEAVSAGADGGVLVVTNDAADDDADFFQATGVASGSTVETFKWESAKKMYMAMRFKISDATQSDFVFGLVLTDTAPLAHTDGFVFTKADGSAALAFAATKNSTTSTVSAVATLANDTWTKIEAFYDGGGSGGKWRIKVDGVPSGKLAVTSNFCDDEELAVTFGIQNGEAVAKILSVDFIDIWKER